MTSSHHSMANRSSFKKTVWERQFPQLDIPLYESILDYAWHGNNFAQRRTASFNSTRICITDDSFSEMQQLKNLINVIQHFKSTVHSNFVLPIWRLDYLYSCTNLILGPCNYNEENDAMVKHHSAIYGYWPKFLCLFTPKSADEKFRCNCLFEISDNLGALRSNSWLSQLQMQHIQRCKERNNTTPFHKQIGRQIQKKCNPRQLPRLSISGANGCSLR